MSLEFHGILIGALSFLIIGIWHPIVIKGEYHLGKKICTFIFAVTGGLCIIISLLVGNLYVSIVLALFGFSAIWAIKEVREQEHRVQRGWFPRKPKY